MMDTSSTSLGKAVPRSAGGEEARARAVLGAYVTGRDNNYNLIRVLAASAVLLSHCYTVASGDSSIEPLRNLLGMSIGDIAVDIFFFASGLLVTGSLCNRASVPSFVRARALRIYPGLIVAVSFTVLIVGPLFTSLPLRAYFGSGETLLYWLRNVTLITNVAHVLPGVFKGNPWPWSVNSSIWTLPYEISMYGILAVFGLSLGLRSARFATRLLAAAIALSVFALMLHFLSDILWRQSALPRLTAMFWIGVTFYLLRDRIRLSAKVAAVFAALLAISILDKRAFLIVYTLSIPYLTICTAYLPAGFLRRYNRIGDYSYGIYIYSFPVQQCVAAVEPGISVVGMCIQSILITGTLAAASWHFVESPMLRLKFGTAKVH